MPSGGTAEFFPGYPGMPSSIVDGVDEARRKIRELIRNGADVIKIATSGGVLSPRDSPDQPGFSLEEIEVMVAEASAFGLWVMSHAQSTVGIKNAVRAGVRSIEHGIYLDDEAIELMLERDAYLVPTLVAPLGVARAAEAGAPIPENVLVKAAEVGRGASGLVPARGGGGSQHRDGHRRRGRPARHESRGAAAHGRPRHVAAEDVLVATTKSAAELMGLESELGTIEPGKRADLVVVAGDPFDFGDLERRHRARLPGRPARRRRPRPSRWPSTV